MKKHIIAFLFILIITSSVASCTKPPHNDVGDDHGNQTPQDNNPNTEISETRSKTSVDYTVNYYDISLDKWNEFSSTALFEGPADPKFFIDEVARLMGITITVNDITTVNDRMTIDFSASSPPLNGTGSYEENCILESISNTLFGVFEEIDHIHITQDGKEYDSGHLSLTPDTPYATRKSEKLG